MDSKNGKAPKSNVKGASSGRFVKKGSGKQSTPVGNRMSKADQSLLKAWKDTYAKRDRRVG